MHSPDIAQLSADLRHVLNTPPTPWLSIKGTHRASTGLEVVDFDFNVKTSNPQLVRLDNELLDTGSIVFSRDELVSHDIAVEIVQDVLGRRDDISLLVSRVTTVDEAALQLKLQQLAIGEVAYGGHVVATIHDLTRSDTFNASPSSSIPSSASPAEANTVTATTTTTATATLTLKTTWTFDWPGFTRNSGPFNGPGVEDQRRRSQMKWSVRVRNAMIDQERGGWIGKEDVVEGGPGLFRAIEKYDLKYDEEEEVVSGGRGKVGRFRFRRWGCDECGDGDG